MEQLATYFLWFMLYSVLGWVWETILCSLTEGHFVYRGFLNGPYCPIYGCGALIDIVFLHWIVNPFALFILGALLASTLEYITSYLMETYFHARWWDYSDKRFNLNGGLVLTSGNYIVSDLAMQVYPNPTNGVFELRFKSDATINSMIQLFDITGKEVYVEKIAAKNGTNLLQINASEFSKGMYMLKLTSGNASTLQKIIID